MPPLRVTVGNAIVCWIIQGQRSLLRGSPPFRSGQPPLIGDGRVPGWEVLPPWGEFTVALFCEPHTSAQGNSPFQSCYTHAATPMGWAADGRASQLLLATVGLFLAVFPWACSGEFTAALPPSGESGSPGVRRSGCSCRHSLGLGGGCASVRFPPAVSPPHWVELALLGQQIPAREPPCKTPVAEMLALERANLDLGRY